MACMPDITWAESRPSCWWQALLPSIKRNYAYMSPSPATEIGNVVRTTISSGTALADILQHKSAA
eukprot:1140377-Pelagomonas_calceolata.AAC.11